MLDWKIITNNGSYVQELEQRIGSLLGVKHCVPTCNESVALELAIKAVGLSSGCNWSGDRAFLHLHPNC
ncbi:MAG: DegT/DnrJ/EryC1/StrS family aminotransferase [Microcoleus sp. PH2017_40_RAT_O_B]|nr:DegT/DnrJ/EryC1/StrS family aminotransferase [Microcoleus sp. PH2017_34_RAT_O_A]MCC3608596.1 DegT/DnrJ/EryC1/StrS family aminotransferase [Microcoleus sp. PH2017_40_RAT_O_B]